jgi:hypothetical protein
MAQSRRHQGISAGRTRPNCSPTAYQGKAPLGAACATLRLFDNPSRRMSGRRSAAARNATLTSLWSQQSLHAAEAHAVALVQPTAPDVRAAVPKKFEDDRLAESINQPPTARCLDAGGCVGVVALDPCGELAGEPT